MISSPIELFIQLDLFSGTVFTSMSPEISIKVDLPFRGNQFCL